MASLVGNAHWYNSGKDRFEAHSIEGNSCCKLPGEELMTWELTDARRELTVF